MPKKNNSGRNTHMRCPCPKCINEVWERMPCRTMPLKGHSQPYGVPYEHKGHPITCCVYGSFLWSLCLQLPLPDCLPPCKKSNEQWSWKSRLTSMPARNSILVLTYKFQHRPLNGKLSHDHIHRQTREIAGCLQAMSPTTARTFSTLVSRVAYSSLPGVPMDTPSWR